MPLGAQEGTDPNCPDAASAPSGSMPQLRWAATQGPGPCRPFLASSPINTNIEGQHRGSAPMGQLFLWRSCRALDVADAEVLYIGSNYSTSAATFRSEIYVVAGQRHIVHG